MPTAWEAESNPDKNAGGTLALGDSTDNEFYITGVQLEVGSVATPFEHRSYGEELALCQRYYQEFGSSRFISAQYHSSYRMASVPFVVPMRATPDLSFDDENAAHTESAYTTNYRADFFVSTTLDSVTEAIDNVVANAEL